MPPSPVLPYLILFKQIGASDIGYISVAEPPNIPFEIKRCYWTYYTPQSVVRGRHAHYELHQILIASAGKIVINTESYDGSSNEYVMDSPDSGLLVPPYCWHTLKFSHNAVLLALCSMKYKESDYIRDYETFRKLIEKP